MRKLFNITTLIAWVAMLGFSLCSCNDDLEIKNDYSFDLEIMPLQSKIKQNETVEIRCQLVREAIYDDARYYIRHFQSDGTGVLKMNDGTVLIPNDTYLLPADKFSLYYTSECAEKQAFDIYITDGFGHVIQTTFNFEHESEPEEEPIKYGYSFTTLPVPSQILLGDTIEIICQLEKEDERNDATYSIRYFQNTGSGILLLGNGVIMQPNELYSLDGETFRLYYVSDCEERQTIDIYIVDSNGQTVQKSFNFENIYIAPEPEVDMSFSLETLPVPKAVAFGETIEIRCKIKKADERNISDYNIRYFQPDGKGTLILDNGTILAPNDLYHLENMEFRLYYTSLCEKQQVIDIYIEDTSGRITQKSFSFQHEEGADNEETVAGDEILQNLSYNTLTIIEPTERK